jgi:hypothetical protein
MNDVAHTNLTFDMDALKLMRQAMDRFSQQWKTRTTSLCCEHCGSNLLFAQHPLANAAVCPTCKTGYMWREGFLGTTSFIPLTSGL